MNNFSSRLLENAVAELSKLPGIGRKTALRLSLYLLKQDVETVDSFGNAIIKLRREINYCKICHNISDSELCEICANPRRDNGVICVVDNIRDVMVIENTGQMTGRYHVLGGIISPMEGIGPGDLEIESLTERVAQGGIREVVLALPTTIEGDTTAFYIFRKIRNYGISISTIARGVSIGDELEYTDEVTLGRSIVNRTPYETTLNK